MGLAYLAYDAALMVFTGWHIRRFTTGARNGWRAEAQHRGADRRLQRVRRSARDHPCPLINQSDPPDEIVIADDGSTDDTAAMVGEMSSASVSTDLR